MQKDKGLLLLLYDSVVWEISYDQIFNRKVWLIEEILQILPKNEKCSVHGEFNSGTRWWLKESNIYLTIILPKANINVNEIWLESVFMEQPIDQKPHKNESEIREVHLFDGKSETNQVIVKKIHVLDYKFLLYMILEFCMTNQLVRGVVIFYF